MTTVTIEQAVEIARTHHQAGSLNEAEGIYRQILAHQPDQPDALHLLGVLAYQQGQADAAIELIRRAIALAPSVAEFHSNLGNILREQGRWEESIEACRQAIFINPLLPDAHNNLGAALRGMGDREDSILAFRHAIKLKPDMAEAYHNLGNALRGLGQMEEAVASLQRAAEIKPDWAECHKNLGIALRGMGKRNEAITAYRQAIQLNPVYTEAYNQLGQILHEHGKLDAASAVVHHVLQINPDMPEMLNNLGNILKLQGDIEGAIAAYDRALVLQPEDSSVASNRVYLLHFHPGYTAPAISEAHRQWNQQYAVPLQSTLRPHTNDPAPHRILKIGYVSPDLREHPVGRFLLPLLENHDHSQFHITGYADVRAPDEITRRLQGSADAWRSTVGLSHEHLADLIRADGIDILVDLTMHMANNRLLVFARQPAPVQVTYLAYCSTTGLDAMDYRLTDPYLDPPGSELDGEADSLYLEIYSERSVWLPQTYWCYQAPDGVPDVGLLPALSAGHITFGCLNNFSKVNDGALSAWCALLRAVPGSRLLLHAGEGSHRQRVSDFLAGEGVSPERLSFAGFVPLEEYFRFYESLDIALDPFPYAGGTTTCDALWMGVPVVSLAGATAVSRGGLSILSNVGLPELVARTPEQYVSVAAELAGDWERLGLLRSSLRERMTSSPLMNGPGFARAVEAAYRQMWHNWCETILKMGETSK